MPQEVKQLDTDEEPKFDSPSLIIAIREALRLSNLDAPNETVAAFQRRGIATVAMEIARGLHQNGAARVLFMDKCGFVGQPI